MAFWVYLLRCADESFYVGHTDDLERRLGQHQAGEFEGYTSTRLPVRLEYSQEFTSRDEALAAERQIKGWSRNKKQALCKGDWSELSLLARRRTPIKPSAEKRTPFETAARKRPPQGER